MAFVKVALNNSPIVSK